MEIEMTIRGLMLDPVTQMPIVILKGVGGEQVLPIWVGHFEAHAIQMEMEKVSAPRPMTHDLIRDLLDALGADVIRVVVTELKTATYYAEIVLRHGDGELPVSSRPSDAVAVAVRTGAPLFVADDLMDSEGIMLAVDEDEDEDEDEDDEGEGANPEELVGEFRNFLDSIRPEDFSS